MNEVARSARTVKHCPEQRIWFNICWISVVCSFAVLFLGETLASLFGWGWIVVFVTAIGAARYTYRVQKALKQHGLARTDPAFIAVAAVLFLLPTVLIGAPAVLANAKKADSWAKNLSL